MLGSQGLCQLGRLPGSSVAYQGYATCLRRHLVDARLFGDPRGDDGLVFPQDAPCPCYELVSPQGRERGAASRSLIAPAAIEV